jgi:hypothetical protein
MIDKQSSPVRDNADQFPDDDESINSNDLDNSPPSITNRGERGEANDKSSIQAKGTLPLHVFVV